MRLLLFGANGQVGWELRRSLAILGDLTALTRHDADLARPSILGSTVRGLAPHVIVNAAAYNAVDHAENEPEVCATINAEAPRALAAEAAVLGSWLVHYSTDQVFDGRADSPYKEDAPTGPMSVYARSKVEGEQHIRASGCKHLILRTSWVHSPRRDNFARRMLKLACERETLDVVADEIAAPTGADLLADITAHALRACLDDPKLGGTYHAVAGGETSRYDYTLFVLEWARARGVQIKTPFGAIHAIRSSDYPSLARRPLNARLDTAKLRTTFKLAPPHWREGVRRMLSEAFPI